MEKNTLCPNTVCNSNCLTAKFFSLTCLPKNKCKKNKIKQIRHLTFSCGEESPFYIYQLNAPGKLSSIKENRLNNFRNINIYFTWYKTDGVWTFCILTLIITMSLIFTLFQVVDKLCFFLELVLQFIHVLNLFVLKRQSLPYCFIRVLFSYVSPSRTESQTVCYLSKPK